MEPDLLPCPFCGGEAERIDMNDLPEDDPNVGGSCICCNRCGASSPVHFDRKENLCSSWNDRAVPASEVQTAREEAGREAADKCDAWAEISERLGLPDARVRAFEDAAANIRALATPPAVPATPGGQHDD